MRRWSNAKSIETRISMCTEIGSIHHPLRLNVYPSREALFLRGSINDLPTSNMHRQQICPP